jgi:hypothetical protein
LQPAVPKLKIGVPGKKWLSGFFSTGSMQNPELRPYVVNSKCPSTFARTKQNPRLPAGMWQWRGQS